MDIHRPYIAISLDQGSHFAKYFVNQYSENCLGLIVLIDRILTEENYKKTFNSITHYDFVRSIVGVDDKKYRIENITNETIREILNRISTTKNSDDWVKLLNGICKGLIRIQYDKIPRMNVNTVIFLDVRSLTPGKLELNIQFNKLSDNKIVYNYVVDDNQYLFYGKYQDMILNSIAGMIQRYI